MPRLRSSKSTSRSSTHDHSPSPSFFCMETRRDHGGGKGLAAYRPRWLAGRAGYHSPSSASLFRLFRSRFPVFVSGIKESCLPARQAGRLDSLIQQTTTNGKKGSFVVVWLPGSVRESGEIVHLPSLCNLVSCSGKTRRQLASLPGTRESNAIYCKGRHIVTFFHLGIGILREGSLYQQKMFH